MVSMPATSLESESLSPEIVRGVERYLRGKTNETMRRNVVELLVQNVEGIFKLNKTSSTIAALPGNLPSRCLLRGQRTRKVVPDGCCSTFRAIPVRLTGITTEVTA